MARGINKVILIGNLGDEPSYRTTSSGTAVTNISMVTNEVRRNIETGQNTELAEWHRVVMWGKLADIAHQWLHKGSQIYIEGKLRTRSYTDKQGVKRTITEIVADEMQMLGGKSQYSPETQMVSGGTGSFGTTNNNPFNQGEQFNQGNQPWNNAPQNNMNQGYDNQQNSGFGGNTGYQNNNYQNPVEPQMNQVGQGSYNSVQNQNNYANSAPQSPYGQSQAPAQNPFGNAQQMPEPNSYQDTSTVDNDDDPLPF